jgi:hypothetical protein
MRILTVDFDKQLILAESVMPVDNIDMLRKYFPRFDNFEDLESSIMERFIHGPNYRIIFTPQASEHLGVKYLSKLESVIKSYNRF